MALGITITKSEITYDAETFQWGFSVEATPTVVGSPVDTNVFVYHFAGEDDPVHGDTFMTVAAVQDMNSMPVGTPVVEDGALVPFYRTSKAEFACDSTSQADYVWCVIQQKLAKLASDTTALEEMKPVASYEL